MRLATRSEARRIDSESIRVTGRDPVEFMEQAGQGMAEMLCRRQLVEKDQSIAIFCGPGNNGGDGFVLGRSLKNRGFTGVRIYYLELATQSELWHQQFSNCCLQGFEPEKIESIKNLDISQFDVFIDALFGVGLSRPLGEPWVSLIAKINGAVSEKKALVISVDTPSGLHCDRGIPWPISIRANWTLTCEIAKPGFFLQEGPSYCGQLIRIPVGFPRSVVQQEANSTRLARVRLISQLFPKRSPVTNKAKLGHLLIIGGSPGMFGALRLCAGAASRLGVGYVSICSLASEQDIRSLPPDFLTLKLSDFYKSDLRKYSAVVVGPGLGRRPAVGKILQHLRAKHGRVLLDADAFTFLASNPMTLPPNWLMTPHAGELARLLDAKASDLEGDRLGAADQAIKKWNCMILFKGFHTLVHNSKYKFIVHSGNAALAKAGTGDVLAGFIGSLMGQGLKTDEAAVLGALIHGDLADRWVRSGLGDFSLRAIDLIRMQREWPNYSPYRKK